MKNMRNNRGYGSPYELVLSGASLIFAIFIIKILLSGGSISSGIVLTFSGVVMTTALVSLTL